MLIVFDNDPMLKCGVTYQLGRVIMSACKLLPFVDVDESIPIGMKMKCPF